MPPEIDMPPELAEGLEELEEVDRFLTSNAASGILIGGKAYAFMAGAHALEVAKRKDTDVLVVSGGHVLPDDTEYDLFLPRSDVAFRNRNDFTLPYHIHYTGPKRLRPGLYLPPPEVIFLTESEMATRRAIDRVVPDIIKMRYMPAALKFKQLAADRVILEFPGDFSWFGTTRPPFPLHIEVTETPQGERRTFISFDTKKHRTLPQTAFPSERDVRTPEMRTTDIFPQTEMSPEEYVQIAVKLIEAGFVKQGMQYLLERAPLCADNVDVPYMVLQHADEFPLQCCEAIGLWLTAAKQHQFTSLLLMGSDSDCARDFGITLHSNYLGFFKFDNKLHELSSKILKEYGPRYLDLAERLANFSIDALLPDTYEQFPPHWLDLLKKIAASSVDGVNRANISTSRLTLKFSATPLCLRDQDEYAFQDETYELFAAIGYTDSELIELAQTHGFISRILRTAENTYLVLSKKLVRSDPRTVAETIQDQPLPDFNWANFLANCVRAALYRNDPPESLRIVGKLALHMSGKTKRDLEIRTTKMVLQKIMDEKSAENDETAAKSAPYLRMLFPRRSR